MVAIVLCFIHPYTKSNNPGEFHKKEERRHRSNLTRNVPGDCFYKRVLGFVDLGLAAVAEGDRVTHVLLLPAVPPPTPGCAVSPPGGVQLVHPCCAHVPTLCTRVHCYTSLQPTNCYTCLLGTDVNPTVQTLLQLQAISFCNSFPIHDQETSRKEILFRYDMYGALLICTGL